MRWLWPPLPLEKLCSLCNSLYVICNQSKVFFFIFFLWHTNKLKISHIESNQFLFSSDQSVTNLGISLYRHWFKISVICGNLTHCSVNYVKSFNNNFLNLFTTNTKLYLTTLMYCDAPCFKIWQCTKKCTFLEMITSILFVMLEKKIFTMFWFLSPSSIPVI